MGRAIATEDGPVEERQARAALSATDIQQVLYVFAEWERPWLLRERSANYAALGSARALEPAKLLHSVRR
jgi:hypothetical protein